MDLARKGHISNGHKVSHPSLDLDETYKAILGSRLAGDHVVLSIPKSRSLGMTRSENEETANAKNVIKRKYGCGGKLGYPRPWDHKITTDAQFSVDVDRLLQSKFGSPMNFECEGSSDSTPVSFAGIGMKLAS